MRIGLFTDTFLPVVNGVSFVVDSTRLELEKLGHEVYIFAPKPTLRFRESDPRVIRFPAIRGISYKANLTSVFFPPNQVKKIKQFELDLIHFFTPNQVGMLGSYVAISQNIPLVGQYCTDIYSYTPFYQSTSWAVAWLPAALPVVSNYPRQHWRDIITRLRDRSTNERWRQRTIGQVMRVVHDQCEYVIAPSAKMVTQLKSFGINAPIQLLPNGADRLPIDRAVQQKFKLRYGLKSSDHIVLYVGRLAVEKNLQVLLKAFAEVAARMDSAKLLLCGDFDYREELEVLANQLDLGDRVIFTGMLNRQQVGSLYAIADVFAFPSLTDTQGLVLHEAAHAGLPIVMIDRGVSPVVKDRINGYLAKNNPHNFAAKLIRVLKNPTLHAKMAKHSRKIAAQYTSKKQAKKLEALYISILKGRY